MAEEDADAPGTSPEAPVKDDAQRFNIRAPYEGTVDNDPVGAEQRVARKPEKIKDVFDLMAGITPDQLFGTIIDAGGDALVVGWTESAKAVNRAVKSAFGQNDQPPPPMPKKKGPAR